MIIHRLASISLNKNQPITKSLAAVFHCEEAPYEASKLPRIVDSAVGAEGGAAGRSFGAGGGCDGRTYTLCEQNVYVLMRRGIRSGRATDEAGTLSEGEGRAKAQALGEESSGLPAGEGYSKPPAGATRTAGGGGGALL